MDEFNKFSTNNLKVAKSVIDEFNKVNFSDPSLVNLSNLITEEIESRSKLVESDFEEFKAKYIGKYVKDIQKRCFRVDCIDYLEDIHIIQIKTKLVLYQDSDWTNIQYSEEYFSMYNLKPNNLNIEGLFEISDTEFKEKLNKTIENGLA